MRRAGAVLALPLVLALVGCGGGPQPAPPPVTFAWREAALPLPPGAPGALVLRDVAGCDGAWFVVGAVRDAGGGTRPAAWTSPDGTTWSALPIEARTFYGAQNVLSAVACHAGRMAAVGAKSGGVHGNPRTSTWQRVASGALREVPPGDFQLFGGPDAVNVGRMAAGPAGFLIAGNRVSGAAVWVSADGGGFGLEQGAPGLASDAAGSTWADDAVAVADGWLVVGGIRPRGSTDRDALGWRSADGRTWSRMPAGAASPANEEMQRVAALDADVVAAGVAGPSFGAWRRDGAGWRPVGSFGAAGAGLPAVTGLVAVGDRLVAVASDSTAYGMWVSPDKGASWRAATMPLAVRAATESAVSLGARGSRLVLVADDGATARLFTGA